MAQKVNIVLVDDIDGTEATQTVVFGLDGSSYEIDLSDANASALREALAPYVGHGRKVGRAARRTARAAAASTGAASAKEIREWAKSNGHAVPERGRIPSDVREAYDAAH
ncbi:MAG TPA: Lsr2 family protein [Nocardioides sp.]|nr:Lsr2 family protein [Nocardioides sp.]